MRIEEMMGDMKRFGEGTPSAGGQTPVPRGRNVRDRGSQPDVQSDGFSMQPGDAVPLLGPSRALTPSPADASRFPLPRTPLPPDLCPRCKGAGYVRANVNFGHPDFGKPILCECKKRELRMKHQERMVALSERFGLQRSKVLSTFRWQLKGVQEAYQETAGIIARLAAWARERETAKEANRRVQPLREWLVFRAPVGTGKTHLAMAIANACIDEGIVAIFVTVPDLLDHLKTTFGPGATATFDALFSQLRDAEVLVVDDLGAQSNSAWAKEKIFQLINHRYNCGLTTVITLNSSAWTYLDERIRSRLQDAQLVICPDMDEAQDYRFNQGKNVTARRRVPDAAGSENSEV